MASLKSQFEAFSKFGDTRSDGTLLTLSQSDKWMKQAKVFDKQLTTTDTAICFGKLKKKAVSFSEYEQFIADLAKTKSMDAKIITDKMVGCGAPGMTGVTQAAASSAVDRLTDTSKYTGAHKQRFDADGKGRGKDGRD